MSRARRVGRILGGAILVYLSVQSVISSPADEASTFQIALFSAAVGGVLALRHARRQGRAVTPSLLARWAWLAGAVVPGIAMILGGGAAGDIGGAVGGALITAGLFAGGFGLLVVSWLSRGNADGRVTQDAISARRAPETQAATAPRLERECPACAELILVQAKYCKHCKRDVEPLSADVPTPVAGSGRESESSRGEAAQSTTRPAASVRPGTNSASVVGTARVKQSTGVSIAAVVVVLVVGAGVRSMMAGDPSEALSPSVRAALASVPEARRPAVERAFERQFRVLMRDPLVRRELGDMSPDQAFALGQQAGSTGLPSLDGDDLAVYARMMSRAFAKLPAETCARLVAGGTPGAADSATLHVALLQAVAASDSAEIEQYAGASMRAVGQATRRAPTRTVSAADIAVAWDYWYTVLPAETAKQIEKALATADSLPAPQSCDAVVLLFRSAAELPEPHRTNMIRAVFQ